MLEQVADRQATAAPGPKTLRLRGTLRAQWCSPLLIRARLRLRVPAYLLVSGTIKGDVTAQLDMVRRRSTVRFRNGAPQLDRIIRKKLVRVTSVPVGTNGFSAGRQPCGHRLIPRRTLMPATGRRGRGFGQAAAAVCGNHEYSADPRKLGM